MHIIQMVGIVTLLFFVALFLMCIFKEYLHSELCNTLFIICNVFFFFYWNLAAHEKGWLKDGWLTLDNISPFIATLIPLTVILKNNLKDLAYCTIAMLHTGMFFAMLISPELEYIFNFKQEAAFIHVSEAACHFGMGLYGVYLILSDRVKLTFNNWLKGTATMLSVIFFATFLNDVFHRDFFGMAMHGKYAIYNIDIFGTFVETFIAYICGVIFVMFMGFWFGKFIYKLADMPTPELLKAPEVEIEDD